MNSDPEKCSPQVLDNPSQGSTHGSASSVGQLMLDPAGRCVSCDADAVRILGYRSRTDLLGRDLRRLLGSNGEGSDIFGVIDLGGNPHQTVQYRTTPISSEAGVRGWLVALIATPDRSTSEERLLESESKYRTLVNNLPGVIWTSDSQGKLVFISSKVEKILGYSGDEAYAMDSALWPGRIHPQDRDKVMRAFASLFANGETFSIEYRIQRKDDTWIWIHDSSFRTYTVGERLYADGMFTDVTESRVLEREKRQGQKMESIGRLTGGIAHDFNNILTIIKGSTEILASDQCLARSAQTEYIEQISQATDRAASLTAQLLAFGRSQVLQPQVLNLNDLLDSVCKVLPRLVGENVDIRFVPEANLDSVKVDASQMEQVIFNLAANARDAMPSGGTLLIRTKNAQVHGEPARREPHVAPGRHVLLEIADTGNGIDPETLNHIFEPFYTTKARGKGTGLGLASVYGIVSQSNGWIRALSTPGEGTTFEVYLPSAGTWQETSTARPEVGVPYSPEKHTIVVAEDEEQIRTLIVRTLRADGHTVYEASSGVEALEFVDRVEIPISLLLTDVVMPKMGGRDLAQRALKSRPELKVVFMSGYPGGDSQTLLSDGNRSHPFLQKPFSLTKLKGVLRDIFKN